MQKLEEILTNFAAWLLAALAAGYGWALVLVFHGPQVSDPAAFEHWSGVMARHYPPAIAVWFMAEGRHGEWRMTGDNAIAAGAQACGAVP